VVDLQVGGYLLGGLKEAICLELSSPQTVAIAR